MTKRQDLCLQRRSRPEQSDQRQANQPATISHQPRTSPDSTSFASRIEFPTMTPELEKRGSEECSMECIAEVQVAFVSAVTFEPFEPWEPSSSFSLARSVCRMSSMSGFPRFVSAPSTSLTHYPPPPPTITCSKSQISSPPSK